MYKITLVGIAILSLFSCKKELTESQKVFLDFAKLEDTYSGGGYYYNLGIHSSYNDKPIYYDSIFNISKLKKELQDSLKLFGAKDGSCTIDYSKTSIPIQYPYSFSFKKMSSNSYNVKLSIFIPDGYEQFSLDKDNIGEKFSKNGMNVTLLDIRNDAATLLVENMAKKNDYSYTYDIRNNNADTIAKEIPIGYSDYLFINEEVDEPNLIEQRSNEKNKDVLQFDSNRLNISVIDNDGKNIECGGRIIDFRHYLWYRNFDMPYRDMTLSYLDIKNRYKEEDKNPNYKYNTIDVINIRGIGKIQKLNFFLRSNKGHVAVIDFGEKFLQKETKEKVDNEFQYYSKYETYTNLNDLIAKKELKINISALKQANSYLLYASLPSQYSKALQFSFYDMFLKTDRNDSIEITNHTNNTSKITAIINKPANIDETSLEISDPKYIYIIGKVGIDRPIYEDKKYAIGNLPKGFTYNKDTNTLEIESENYLDDFEIYGFESLNSKKSIPTVNLEPIHEYNYQLRYKFKTTPSHIIARNKKDVNDMYVPFKLKIPQKE